MKSSRREFLQWAAAAGAVGLAGRQQAPAGDAAVSAATLEAAAARPVLNLPGIAAPVIVESIEPRSRAMACCTGVLLAALLAHVASGGLGAAEQREELAMSRPLAIKAVHCDRSAAPVPPLATLILVSGSRRLRYSSDVPIPSSTRFVEHPGMSDRVPAALLLGPTGSGKTPLGELLQARGLKGRRCVHFDFGENMRAAVRHPSGTCGLSADEVEFLRGVLARGALLEDRDFPLAGRILGDFLVRSRLAASDVVVLNGLPRHVGQALAIQGVLAVRQVVCLDCSAPTVLERIRRDTGGDRRGRSDDDLPAVARKLAIYAERTAPLIDFYRDRAAPIIRLQVTANTTPEAAWESLQRAM